MEVLDRIARTCRAAAPRIVLSEGGDVRVVEAACRAAADGLARISIVGTRDRFEELSKGHAGADRVEVFDPATSDLTPRYADAYLELRRHKGMDATRARETMETRLGFAAMMVRSGDADGTIGGAVATTADTVRTALQVIGKAPDTDVVSSYFLMVLAEPFSHPVIFADCGLVIEPDAGELASIAIASSRSLNALTGETPRVGMLSFSTKGSVPAKAHPSLQRIQEATRLVQSRAPDLPIDGELQFDAAILPEIAAKKAPGSPIGGQANVLIFPDLNAGNIGYKIAQRLGGAVALGPILQGLAKPANDLSRGCSAEDIYRMIAITGAQAVAGTS